MRSLHYALVATIALLAGCVNTDYTGKTYAPTTQVDVYYSERDVPNEFEVMGTIKATAMDGWDSNQMIEELRTQAMAKGADGLVVQDVHTEVTGSTTSTTGNAKNDSKWVVTKDGKLKEKNSGGGKYSETSITTETREKVIDAELIKYR